MKRLVVLLMFLTFLLTSCNVSSNVNGMELAVAGNEWAKFGFDIEGEDEFKSDHIVTEDIFDRKMLLDTVDSYVESQNASDIFISFYQQADTIDILPIFSMYLECTDLAVVTFSLENDIFGVKIVDFKDNLKSLVEFDSDWTPDAFAHHPFSDEGCLGNFRACFEVNPNFEVIGVIFDYAPLSNTHLLGKHADSKKLQYADGSVICDFGYVDSFDTVEAGRLAYRDFFARRNIWLSDLLIFPWQEETIGYYTDWNYYINTISFTEAGVSEEEMVSLQHCNDLVCVPLLDMEGNEGIYQMYLLYHNNHLVAQMVFQNHEVGASLVYHCVNGSVTSENYDTAYMFVLRRAEEALGKNRNALRVFGVAFDGESFIPVANNDMHTYCYDEEGNQWVRTDKG